MKHRIRAAALIEKEGKLLLVEHRDSRGNRWWIPPGGGLEESDPSILDCVKREVREETGVAIEIGTLRYIREFIDQSNGTRHLELFFAAALIDAGSHAFPAVAPTLFDPMIMSAKWLSRPEMRGIAVYPDILKDGYWEESGKEAPKYLGVSIEST